MNRRRRSVLQLAAVVALAALAVVPLAGSAPAPTPPDASLSVTTSSEPTIALAPSSTVEVAAAAPAGWAGRDLGALDPSVPISVAVGLASRDPSGLLAYIAAASTPGTPEFGHPLSAAAADARFGASPSAVRAAEAYFERYGLGATANPDGLLVDLSGPSGRMARAFGTALDIYRAADGGTVYAPRTTATLPAIAPWTGALGLGNASPARPAAWAGSLAGAPRPSATCVAVGSDYLPCNIAAAYDITTLGLNGSGRRIAVVDAYSGQENQTKLETDLAAFAALAGVAVGNVSYLYPVPSNISLNSSGTNPLWGDEEALDLEWARGIAPGATIDMTFSPNPGDGLYEAVDWIVAHAAADVISLSWGEPDVGVYNAYAGPCAAACNASTDGSYAILGPVLELAAVEGIGVFAAAGDCGSADGTSGVATNFPASDPFVTGVGGTNLSMVGSSYGSEVPWGGNATGRTSPGCQNQGGSGGGYAPFPRPWWQTGLPTGAVARGVPDVSMDAGIPVTIEYHGGEEAVGGTSVSTPIWAGIAAIADESAHADLGFLNPSLYRILGSGRYASDFHDIASGRGNGYPPRAGWDPVTGIGTPIVDQLVVDLARGGAVEGGSLSTFVTATPDHGGAPLPVVFAVDTSGGAGTYPIQGVSFGNANASLTRTGSVSYTYATPGVYLAQSFAVDSGGNVTVSPPVAVVVGGATPLAVTLNVSNAAPTNGSSVTFTAAATGGTAPYNYSFWFGDGSYANGLTTPSTVHTYRTAGAFCAAVVVADSAHPPAGGASSGTAVTVGGAAGAGCGSGVTPLVVTPEANPPIRDAPADFPNLFTVSGGTVGNGHPAPTITLASTDPYVAACQCAILRSAGNYSVTETAVDSAHVSANATINLTVAPALNATFSATTLAGPIPWTVHLTSAVSGGYRASAAATRWSSGEGTSSVGATASFTYNRSGEYLVTGVVGDSGFGNASESFLVDAEPSGTPAPLGVTATITPSEAIASGTTVAFTASIVGATGPVLPFWEFGDGHSAAGPSANETFFATPPPANDVATVDLLVMGAGVVQLDNLSLPLPDFFAVASGGFVPATDDLALAASATPTLGPAPLTVSGTGTTSGPGGASVLWEFGDGVSVGGTSAGHALAVAGNYTVAAIGSDAYGDRAVLSEAVVVTVPLALVGGPSTLSGDAPLSVDFSARVTGGVGGYIYLWSFGDGGSSTNATGSTTYRSPGTYNVSVQVDDRLGESLVENWSVVVHLSAGFPVAVLAVGAGAGIVLAVVLGGLVRRRRPRPPVTP